MKFLLFLQLGLATATFGLERSPKVAEFEHILSLIEADYAFLDYKVQNQILDYEGAKQRVYQNIPTASETEYRYLMRQFIAEFKDSHMSLTFPDDGGTELGFTTEWIEGRVLVDVVEDGISLERGDEILSWGGKPVRREIEEIGRYFPSSTPSGLEHLSVYVLPYRPRRHLPAPEGVQQLEVRKRSGEVVDIELPWREIKSDAEPSAAPRLFAGLDLSNWCSLQSTLRPPEGAVVFDLPFDAYRFPYKGKMIGLLRIPHFQDFDGGYEISKVINMYREAVARMEQETDALIIDQKYNCGGSVTYVLAMTALFAEESFTPTEFSFRASESQISDMEGHLESFDPSLSSYDSFQSVLERVRKAVAESVPFTEKFPFWGFMGMNYDLPRENGKVLVEQNRYTKPIVLLIDEMAGSGGDMFPALMKDLGRAELIGQTTMGAGGHRWVGSELEYSKATLALTKSIIYRTDGSILENNGVRPHIPYSPTMGDFDHGGRDYLGFASERLIERLRP